MTHENQVAQPVHFRVSAKNRESQVEVAVAKGSMHVAQHLFQARGHERQIADILQVDAASHCSRSVAAIQKQVPDSLQADNELQAGQQLAGVHLADFGNDGGNTLVDL